LGVAAAEDAVVTDVADDKPLVLPLLVEDVVPAVSERSRIRMVFEDVTLPLPPPPTLPLVQLGQTPGSLPSSDMAPNPTLPLAPLLRRRSPRKTSLNPLRIDDDDNGACVADGGGGGSCIGTGTGRLGSSGRSGKEFINPEIPRCSRNEVESVLAPPALVLPVVLPRRTGGVERAAGDENVSSSGDVVIAVVVEVVVVAGVTCFHISARGRGIEVVVVGVDVVIVGVAAEVEEEEEALIERPRREPPRERRTAAAAAVATWGP
jgi:hypothetical protein